MRFLYDNWQSIVTLLNTDLIDSESFYKTKSFLSINRNNLVKQLLNINAFRKF